MSGSCGKRFLHHRVDGDEAIEKRGESSKGKRIRAIALGPCGVFVHFQKDAIHASANAGGCERLDVVRKSRADAVAGSSGCQSSKL